MIRVAWMWLAIVAALAVALAAARCASPPAGSERPPANPPSVAVRETRPPLVAAPPGAILDPGDGRTIAGVVGSYELDGAADDAPWLPASALTLAEIGADRSLAIRFVDGTPIGGWTADIARADDPRGARLTGIGSALGLRAPIDSARIGRVPAGAWVLEVRLFLADGSGDASYYWSLNAR